MSDYPDHITNAVDSVYSSLYSLLEHSNNVALSFVQQFYGKDSSVELKIYKLTHVDYAQGRLSQLKVNNKTVGMMFFLLPKPNTDTLLFGADIMSSPYAISLVALCVNASSGYSESLSVNSKNYIKALENDLLSFGKKRNGRNSLITK